MIVKQKLSIPVLPKWKKTDSEGLTAGGVVNLGKGQAGKLERRDKTGIARHL
jgi:hypothetical protein